MTLKRNARERDRVRNINEAFESLRSRLPMNKNSKKPSKYETLQAAIDYINELRSIASLADVSAPSAAVFVPESPPMRYVSRDVQSPESGFSSISSTSGAQDQSAHSPTTQHFKTEEEQQITYAPLPPPPVSMLYYQPKSAEVFYPKTELEQGYAATYPSPYYPQAIVYGQEK